MEKATATRQAGDKTAPQSPISAPSPQSPANPWFGMQQKMGNQALRRLMQHGLLQAKLGGRPPEDPYEQEADRAAERIVRRTHTAIIQRKCSCGGSCAKCAGEDEERGLPRLQLLPLSSRLQRAARDAVAGPEAKTLPENDRGPTLGLIVDDEASISSPGQMKKSAFFKLLQADVCATADAELMAVGRSTKSCPYIEKWLDFYREQSAAHIERALLKYAPEAADATNARDYIVFVRHRVRRAVALWAKTGRITGVPPGVGLMPSSREGGESKKKDEGLGTRLLRAVSGREQFKKREGTNTKTTDAESVRYQLGHGRPLDSRTRGHMESAFGSDFSSVRIHDDAASWGLSSQLNARAFTVGNDVAFGTGEYQPGTPVGDALIAHELAHVVQQGAATQSNAPMLKGDSDYNALEADADTAAVGAMASVWAGAKGKLADIARNASPRLKSGLKLQRCNGDCPPGYCWQVFAADAGWVSCTCHWRCSSVPTSGPSISDPYAPTPSVPTDYRHNIGALGATQTIVTAGCLCPDLPNDRGAVCGNRGVIDPTSDVRDIGAAVGGLAEGRARSSQQTTESKPTARIEGPPIAGEGKGTEVSKAAGEKQETKGETPSVPPTQTQQRAPSQKAVTSPPPAVEQKGTGAVPPQPTEKTEAQKGATDVKQQQPAQQEGEVAKEKTPPTTETGEEKTTTPTQTTTPAQTTTPTDIPKRLEEIRKERSQVLDQMKELDEKRVAAEGRQREASAEAARTQDPKKRADLLDKARRNGESAQKWKDDRDTLRIRSNALADEEARLAPRAAKPATWQEAEDALRKEFGGVKKTFVLPGGNRDVDCSTPDRISREAKFGPQGLGSHIQLEIDKDSQLLKSGAVTAVEWHFYENVKGDKGPSGPLAEALRNANIRIVMH